MNSSFLSLVSFFLSTFKWMCQSMWLLTSFSWKPLQLPDCPWVLLTNKVCVSVCVCERVCVCAQSFHWLSLPFVYTFTHRTAVTPTLFEHKGLLAVTYVGWMLTEAKECTPLGQTQHTHTHTDTHTHLSFLEKHLKTQSELLTCCCFWDGRHSSRDGGGNVALCRRQAGSMKGTYEKNAHCL